MNNMLRYILLFSIVCTMGAKNKHEDAANHLIQFHTMEKGHKSDWFDYEGKLHEEKYKMLKEFHKECADLKIECAEELKKLDTISKKNELLYDHLEKAMKLHEKQVKECRKFWADQKDIAHKLYKKHKKELKEFKQKAGLIEEKPEIKDEHHTTPDKEHESKKDHEMKKEKNKKK